MEQYRHGDLLIVPCQEPKKARKDDKLILAYGEVTGHAHRLSDGEVRVKDGTTFFRANDKTTLTHEEHGPIVFKKGWYRVINQREYDPERGERGVID